MPDTVNEIAQLQKEYDALARDGAEKFGAKARALLEKQLRDEMKKKLDATLGDIDAFKAKKSEVATKLRDAKARRRAEIIKGIGDGSLKNLDAARAEIIGLGWEPGVADSDIVTAKQNPEPTRVTTDAAEITELSAAKKTPAAKAIVSKPASK